MPAYFLDSVDFLSVLLYNYYEILYADVASKGDGKGTVIKMNIGEKYTVKIEDTTLMGAGVAKIDGAAVFVDGTLKGDECSVTVTEVKKNFATAVCDAFTAYSSERIGSDCPHSDMCGGCVFRHATYEYENTVKESAVRSAFNKARLETEKFNGILYPDVSCVRNKATFHFDRDGNAGFYMSDSRTLIPLGDAKCKNCPETFCGICEIVSVLIREGVDTPDEMMLRAGYSGEIVAAFTGNVNESDLGRLAVKICSAYPDVTGIVTRRTVKDKYKTVMGEKYVTGRILGLDFKVSPEAFFQVNYEGAEKLFSEVLRLAETLSFDYCADLYCGTGTIGMILASRFKDARFTGVEINEEAVRDAKRNAAANGLKNIKFFCGDAGKYADSEKPQLVVVDPPRRGLSDGMIKILSDISPESIIYVSCNPFTLVRDLGKITSDGYAIREVTAVNMFPRSEHVESVVMLSR